MRKISDRLVGCTVAAVGLIISVFVIASPEKVTAEAEPETVEEETWNEVAEIEKISEIQVEEASTIFQETEAEKTMAAEPETGTEAEETMAAEPETGTEAEKTIEETETEGYHTSSAVSLDTELQEYIERKCEAEEISYPLILAVMWVETRWNWTEGDNGKAVGYMQIWPTYWDSFAAAYGYEIDDHCGNIATGIKIIKHLMDKNSGDLYKALSEYNTGDPEAHNGYADLVLEKESELEELLYE